MKNVYLFLILIFTFFILSAQPGSGSKFNVNEYPRNANSHKPLGKITDTTRISTFKALTKIIVVRHAEKEENNSQNPPLSVEGNLRAEKLSFILSHFQINTLFSTPYLRTRQTLEPIADLFELTISEYNPLDPEFAKNVLMNFQGKTIVIAGHSNSAPGLVNSLIKNNTYPPMNENDYGKIWVLLFNDQKLLDCSLYQY